MSPELPLTPPRPPLPPFLAMPHPLSLSPRTSACAVALAALQGLTLAQSPSRDDMYFSITWRGPSIGLPSGPNTVTSGDILQPQAPGTALGATAPKIFLPAAAIDLQGLCDEVPGLSCGQELDALSFGFDTKLGREASATEAIHFSVDRHAQGITASFLQQGVWTEALLHDHGADVMASNWSGAPDPAAPMAIGHNFISIDGDGVAAAGGLGAERPGSGLAEPNNPATGWPMSLHDRGDELDALDLGTARQDTQGRFYFSVQGGGVDVLDPTGTPPVPDTAKVERISAADVLTGRRGAPHRLYARSGMLGLDPRHDDIDALIIGENGQAGYQMPPRPFEWGDQRYDMVIFSVRRGSAIIGTPDSALGLPITEGDLLTAPGTWGGAPAIVATAESLGLRAERGGVSGESDELDGATVDKYDFPDCNDNNVDDRLDIFHGASFDTNHDGIPDECQYEGGDFGSCPDGSSPICANLDFWAGCENNTGVGGGLHCLGPVDALDGFRFSGTNLPASQLAVLYHSDATAPAPATMGNGLLFLGGSLNMVGSLMSTSWDGTLLTDPGILAELGSAAPLAGQSSFFQLIYRDLGGPCGASWNITNGVKLNH